MVARLRDERPSNLHSWTAQIRGASELGTVPQRDRGISAEHMNTDTPETNAAIKESSKWRKPLISASINGVTWDGPVAALCRKLERERDEARKLANDIDLCQGGVAPCELAVKIMEKLDEAQKLSSALHEDQTNLILERDKAINQSVKLCDLAERMLKEMEYVDWLSTAAVFRDELNKIKEENK